MDTPSRRSYWPTVISVILGVGVLLVTLRVPGGDLGGGRLAMAILRNASLVAIISAIQMALGFLALIFSKGRPKGRAFILIVVGCAYAFISVALYSQGHSEYRKEFGLSIEKNTAGRTLLACMIYASAHRGEWPRSLEELSPDYLPEQEVRKAVSGDETLPGFAYIAPATTSSTSSIVIMSRTEVSKLNHKWVVGYSDGRVLIEQNPSLP